MQFRVLGPLEVAEGERVVTPSSARRRRLLAALLAHAGRVVSLEGLVDAVWGDDPPPSAHLSLRSHVSRLRATLAELEAEPERLVTRGGGYALALTEADEVDAAEFEREVAEARAALEAEAASALDLVERALARWRGPPYADAAGAVDDEVRRLETVHGDARDLRVDALLALGHHETVVSELQGRAEKDPLDERVAGQLMVALFRSGHQAAAVEAYHAFRERLADELGVDPSPPLQARYQALLRQAPELAAPPGPPTGGEQAPRGEGLAGTAAGRHDAPRQPGWSAGASRMNGHGTHRALTSLVGRDEAVAAVAGLLAHRVLVTLTGPGGVGKTRLARAVAEHVRDDFDDVAFVELAPVQDPAALEPAIAGALGAVAGADASIRDQLVAVLGAGRWLLVVDNCEHLLPQAGELVDHLVRRCPALVVLATSRERLAVDGEHRWPVPPLDPPGRHDEAHPERVGQSPAVQLFCERAAAAEPGFTLTAGNAAAVAELCRRLDGVPLTLELAAARVPAFPVSELVARLDERFRLLTAGPRGEGGRHRTLREVIDWSYELLDEREARLFERVSVFAGGFTLDAAENVGAHDEPSAGDVAGALASLVDKSMVSRSGARYELLETLRVYGLARLTDHGEAGPTREAHARYFAGFAEQAGQASTGPDDHVWVVRLEDELDNLRVAHRWAVEADDADLALRLSAPLAYFADWWLIDEIPAWAEEAAAAAGAGDHELLALAYGLAARGAGNRGELDRSATLARRGLAAAPDEDDPRRVLPLKALSLVAFYGGRLEQSARLEAEVLRLAEAAGDAYNVAYVYVMKTLIATYRDDDDRARSASAQACAEAEALGNVHLRAMAAYCRGEALAAHDPEEALRWLEKAITTARDVGARLAEAIALVTRSSIHGEQGHPDAALASFREAIVRLRRGGDWTHQWTTLRNLLFLFARIGADEPAAALLGALESTETAAEVYGADARRQQDTSAQLRARLGEGRFAAVHAEGERMSDTEAVDAALAAIDEHLADTAD